MSRRSPSNAKVRVAVINSRGGSLSERTARQWLGLGKKSMLWSVRKIIIVFIHAIGHKQHLARLLEGEREMVWVMMHSPSLSSFSMPPKCV
jgi:hypothetical protein